MRRRRYSTEELNHRTMIPEDSRSDEQSEDVQLSHLLHKVRNLLEVAKKHFYRQGANSETIQRIEKTLNAIEALPDQFNKN